MLLFGEGPASLIGKVFDSKCRGLEFELHCILWLFLFVSLGLMYQIIKTLVWYRLNA